MVLQPRSAPTLFAQRVIGCCPRCLQPAHLCKLNEAAAGVSRGGDEHLGVNLPRVSILVVNVVASDGGIVILQLNLLAQLLLVLAELRRDGLALCSTIHLTEG